MGPTANTSEHLASKTVHRLGQRLLNRSPYHLIMHHIIEFNVLIVLIRFEASAIFQKKA